MSAVLLVFGLVFVAELGDKSQLLALSFATRHSARRVVAGFLLAVTATQALSVAAGGLLGAVVRGPAVTALAGVVFLAFAAVALRRGLAAGPAAAEQGPGPTRSRGSVVLAVASSVFLAEIGDKTMIVTMALAAREGVVPAFVGSVAGMAAAGLVGILLGRSLQDRVPERVLRLGAAALFATFGVVFLLEALRGV
jgi:Ca2+/H+ antiporter, TMEM165/GDT1 family